MQAILLSSSWGRMTLEDRWLREVLLWTNDNVCPAMSVLSRTPFILIALTPLVIFVTRFTTLLVALTSTISHKGQLFPVDMKQFVDAVIYLMRISGLVALVVGAFQCLRPSIVPFVMSIISTVYMNAQWTRNMLPSINRPETRCFHVSRFPFALSIQNHHQEFPMFQLLLPRRFVET